MQSSRPAGCRNVSEAGPPKLSTLRVFGRRMDGKGSSYLLNSLCLSPVFSLSLPLPLYARSALALIAVPVDAAGDRRLAIALSLIVTRPLNDEPDR